MSEIKGYVAEIASDTGVNVNRCYQCGKCSAGCAVNLEMDYPPSVVMRMLQTGDTNNLDEILKSESIWLCVSCQNCLTRCPMQIDIPGLMDYMREKALAKGIANKKAKNILSFHKAFLDSVKYTGRLYEIGLVANYKLRSFKLTQDLDVVPGMLARGKLPFIPELVEDRKNISRIFAKTTGEHKTQK